MVTRRGVNAIESKPYRLVPGLFILLFLASTSFAADYTRLSPAEKRSVDRGLKEYGLEVVGEPEGSAVGRYYIHTEEVFNEDDGWLEVFNVLHATSKDVVIEVETILREGDAFDWSTLNDMERNLRNASVRSLVVIIPVRPTDAPANAPTDLLITTRDIWSLRANSDFEIGGTSFTYLYVEIAENNLGGWNKLLAATFEYQPDTIAIGARYVDPRLAWSRFALSVNHSFLINHATGDYEGLFGGATVSYPQFTQTQKWFGSVSAGYNTQISRAFIGAEQRLYDNPETEDIESVPVEYDFESYAASVSATRSFGVGLKHDIRFGYGYSESDAALRDDFPDDPVLRDAFRSTFFPRTERQSSIRLAYEVYFWEFGRLYDYNTYGLIEEFRTGPFAEASARWSGRWLGSDVEFGTFALSMGWTEIPGNSWLISGSATMSGRLEFSDAHDGELIDEQLSGAIRFASPPLGPAGRLHVRLGAAWQIDNTANSLFALGSDNGLRGFSPSALLGEHRVRGNFEYRTSSFKLWILRIGGTAFYDGGDAFDSGEFNWKHTVGVGLRVLVLPVNRDVLRVDYAIPLNGPNPGFRHGVISAGFGQGF